MVCAQLFEVIFPVFSFFFFRTSRLRRKSEYSALFPLSVERGTATVNKCLTSLPFCFPLREVKGRLTAPLGGYSIPSFPFSWPKSSGDCRERTSVSSPFSFLPLRVMRWSDRVVLSHLFFPLRIYWEFMAGRCFCYVLQTRCSPSPLSHL